MPAARKFSDEIITTIATQYVAEVSIRQLCKEYDCDARVIKRLLRTKGVTIRPMSRLIGNEPEIVARYVAGESMESLAKIYRIDPRYVRKAIWDSDTKQRTMCEANRRRGLDETFFDEINTEAKAYFLGFLYADGCNRDSEGRFVLALQLRDLPILEEFKRQLTYEGAIQIREKLNKATLTIGSRYMSDRLTELGCTARKTFTLQFPDWLKDTMLQHFTRGFIDGDGCFYLGKRSVCISAVSVTGFIQSLANHLSEQCQVNTSIAPHHASKGISYMKVQGTIQARRIADYLYNNATIYLQRKRDKAAMLIPQERGGENCHFAILSPDLVKEIHDRLMAGGRVNQIALDYPISPSSIQHIKKGQSWKCLTGVVYDPTSKETCAGSRNAMAKLTESDIPAIRKLLAEGVNLEKIAQQYSVSGAAIRMIQKGKTWKHVTVHTS